MKFKNIRKNYTFGILTRKDLSKNPIIQFKNWLKEAIKAELIEPNAMALSTSTKNGKPSCRMVLLKHVDESGFVFFTNYNSQKSKEIGENNFASLTFWWKEFERQVRVEGIVEKTTVEESALYFSKRPRNSQIAAIASKQDEKIPSREFLENEYAKIEKLYEGKKIPLPEFWGGFRLIPHAFEFWQGREDRLHDRFLYSKNNESWVIDRLSP